MLLSYLILSHLLGDFVFQPSKLVMWKMKSFYGVLVHVLIHLVVMVLVLLPLILNGNLWLLWLIAMISAVHVIVDQSKISYDLKHDKKVAPFVVDQVLHFTTLLIGVILTQSEALLYPATKFFSIYVSVKTIVFISAMVFVSKVLEVYRYQKQLEKDKFSKIEFRTRPMVQRMLMFGLMYICITFLVFYT